MVNSELVLKYRPDKWEDVVGQGATCRSIQAALKGKKGRAFLLTGPSGVGKTTIARLIAQTIGADLNQGGYTEIDAATTNGVDDVRELKAKIQLKPLGGGNRVICVDECHQLSKQAWNALLKSVEEPPAGVHWVFCTTEAGKVIETIKTRCLEYQLVAVNEHDLGDLLEYVVEEEKLKPLDGLIDAILAVAQGSPRAALSALAKASSCKTLAEVDEVLQTVSAEGSPEVIDFCRALMNGASRVSLLSMLGSMQGQSAEGVRNVVCAYFTKVALNPKGNKFEQSVAILIAFGTPYPPCNNLLYPVVLSIAQLFRRDDDE